MEKKTKFISPFRSFRLVIEPSEPKTKWGPGVKGKAVQFSFGMYETADPEIIAWLKNHNEYGVTFWEHDDVGASKFLDSTLMEKSKVDPIKIILSRLEPGQIKRLGELLIEEGVKKGAKDTEEEEEEKEEKPDKK